MLRVLLLMALFLPAKLYSQCPVVNLGPDTLVCTGTSVTLDAGNPGATYMWSDGSTSAQFLTFFEGEYWVDVTLNGCTISDTIYVQHGPVLYADFSFEQTSTCSPLTVAFTQITEACSGPIASITWNFGDGNTSTQNDPVHGYDLPGVYSVTLTATLSNGTTYTANHSVAVAGGISPVLDLGADISMCSGEQVTLNAGNAGSTYLWSTGSTTSSIDVSTSGQYWVQVTNNGCTINDTVNVTVTPYLWNNFAFTKLADCSPVSFQFTDRSTTCTGTITGWYWQFGDGATSTSQNPQHDYYSSGQYNVRLTITDDQGNTSQRTRRVNVVLTSFDVDLGNDTIICAGNTLRLNVAEAGASYLWSTGETTAAINVSSVGEYYVAVTKNSCTISDTIYVNTAASVNANWGYSTGAACLPVPVSFTDSSLAFCNQQVTAWHWDFGDGSTSSLQNPVHHYNSSDSFVVRLTATVSNGAQATFTRKIGISNTPFSLNLPDRIMVCRGDSFSLDAGIADAAYTWTPVMSFSNPNAARPRATAATSGWFKLEATRCMLSQTDSIYVVLDSALKPRIEQEGAVLKASRAESYQWYKNGQAMSGANRQNFRLTGNGYYSVRITNRNGCTAMSDSTYFITPADGAEEREPIVIRCSPNPTPGPFSIILSRVPDKPIKFTLLDRYGRALHIVQVRQHVTAVRVPNLTPGMYFLESVIYNKKRIVPVVIQ